MLRTLLALVLASAFALAALFTWRRALPDVEIRYSPRQTNAGRIFPGHALGQGFRCEFDGLHALDVALAPLGGGAPTELQLVLHAGEPTGPAIRRVTLDGERLPRTDGWARFEFDPVPDSRGATFWFELASSSPSTHGPWVRYRGVPYLVRPWGSRVFDARAQEGDLLPSPPREGRPDVLFADLAALAFAVDGLDAAAGPATLALSDPKTGELLRTAELAPRAPIASGWAFFAFEPLADTRYRALHYRLELPAGARLVGDEQGHSLIAFHAAGELDGEVFGATCRGEKLSDRDLVFRAWSDGSVGALATRLGARAGWKIAAGALLWSAAVGVIAALVRASQRAIET